ncbi:MAG: hypothetical protein ACSLEL_05550 [Candidatus Malihini olakiniferum]
MAAFQVNLVCSSIPQQIDATIEQFQYQFQGVGVPSGGIIGNGSL